MGTVTRRAPALLLVAASLLLAPSPCAAAEEGRDVFAGSAGVLFSVGGNILTEAYPAYLNPCWGDMWAPFNLISGGFGVGGGLFLEARFERYFGMEAGLLFERSSIQDGGYEGTPKYTMKYLAVRLPVLVKAIIETRVVRISLGFGPEFFFSRHGSMKEEVDNTLTPMPPYPPRHTGRKEANHVFICTSLGLAFKIGKLTIPVRLRYSHNLTLPSGYHERNDFVPDPWGEGDYIHPPAHTIDLRLLVGLAYEF